MAEIALGAQLDELVTTLQRTRSLLPEIARVGAVLGSAICSGRKILTAGNGGSAADALHFAEELLGRFNRERRSLPAISLCADPTTLTCIGNDYGFEKIFSRQVEGLAAPGDVVLIFSTSGQSPNLLEALRAAKTAGATSVALLGKNGGAARELADHSVIVPSESTARIQEVHAFILHAWIREIEDAIGNSP